MGNSGSHGPDRMLAARSGVYLVLARGFSFPDEKFKPFFEGFSEGGGLEAGGIDSTIDGLLLSARSATLEELRSAYNRLFDPVAGPFPYGVEHAKGDEFGKAHSMADIMGFYRAFGVEPHDERPDHIASELEFMHLLTLKEHHALETGQRENAATCRDAQRKFFTQHIEPWSDELIGKMRDRSDGDLVPFYTHLTDLYQMFIESEKESLS